jgi:hypothetical protein
MTESERGHRIYIIIISVFTIIICLIIAKDMMKLSYFKLLYNS